MQTLTSTLEAAQQANARRPAHILSLQKRPYSSTNPPLHEWTRYYTGAEADDPVDAAVATDGSLVRVRANGTTIEHNRVSSPGAGSTYSTWTTLASAQTDGPVAIDAGPSGELVALWTRNSGLTLVAAVSTDSGASWGSPADLVTEASAIVDIAVSFKRGHGTDPDDLCAFYVLANGDVKRLRRTAGSWAGSGTSWTRGADTNSVTGIGATYDGSDFNLAVTGTDTDDNPRLWTVIMGDGGLPANVWGSLVTLQEADAEATASFHHPDIDYATAGTVLTYTLTEAGNVAHSRTYFTATPGIVTSTGWWEPAPLEAASAEGAAICRGGLTTTNADHWLVTSSGVWFAELPETLGAEDSLLAYDIAFGPESTRAIIELDDTVEVADLASYTGGIAQLSLGYVTSTGAEYGRVLTLHIDAIARTVTDGHRLALLRCSGPWEATQHFHNPQAWQVDANTLTRTQLVTRIATRARVPVSGGAGSEQPSFAWQAGESAAAALKRLLAVSESAVRHDDGFFRLHTLPTTSSYTYGPADHPVDRLTLTTAPPPANWTRLQGPDRYADAYDHPSIDRYGPRLTIHRNLDATTDPKAQDYATATLERHTTRHPAGTLTAPANVGQELHDVVTVNHPHLPNADYRVIGLRFRFARTTKQPRYDIELELGAL